MDPRIAEALIHFSEEYFNDEDENSLDSESPFEDDEVVSDSGEKTAEISHILFPYSENHQRYQDLNSLFGFKRRLTSPTNLKTQANVYNKHKKQRLEA